MRDTKRNTLRYLTGFLLVLLALGGVLLMLAGSLIGVGAVVAAAIAISFTWKWADTRCPHCKRGYALGSLHREEVERESVQLQDSVPYRADEVRTNFSLERVVPGTRVVYREEQRCRYCGQVSARTVIVNKKQI